MNHSGTGNHPGCLWTWPILSAALFGSFVLIALLLVMLINGSWVNHLLFPAGSYLSMFQLLWQDNPLGSLQFIVTKSFITFAHNDPRSSLNLWTLDFDGVTLAVYLLAAVLGGRLLLPERGRAKPRLFITLAGILALVFSATYMSVLAHCAGPTWAGFVTLYGLGAEELTVTPVWQLLLGGAGLGILIGQLLQAKRAA